MSTYIFVKIKPGPIGDQPVFVLVIFSQLFSREYTRGGNRRAQPDTCCNHKGQRASSAQNGGKREAFRGGGLFRRNGCDTDGPSGFRVPLQAFQVRTDFGGVLVT